MKRMVFSLLFGACAVSAWGTVFQMDRRGDAVVEVDKVGGEYKVTCTFSPQTKFDSARNAKFNDAKGDSLCKKGIARYLGVGADDAFSVSGLYSAAPVKKDGGKLRYSFAVPVAGCRIEGVAARQKAVSGTVVPSTPKVAAATPVKVPSVPKVAAVAPAKPQAGKVVRSVSYMSVVKYKEVNGSRSVVTKKEYRGSDFKSREEFDQFCARELARVRALGEQNIRAVRNQGRK